MRISYLIHQFSPKHMSSVEQYCFNLAREMKKRGNAVSIFMYQYSNQGAKLQKGTTDMTMDGMLLREVYHNYKMLKDADRYEYFNPVIKEYAKKYFEEFKPDIVHVMHLKNLSTSVIDAAHDLNIPVVMTPIDFWMLCPNFTLLRADYEVCRGPFEDTPCDLCISESSDSLGKKIADLKHQPVTSKLKERIKDSFVSSMAKKFVDGITNTMHMQRQWAGIDRQLERKDFIMRKCEKLKKILAPSQFVKDVLMENGYDGSYIDVLTLGFDLPVPEEVETKASENLRIGYIGTINKHKGTHLIIEAVKGIQTKHVELKIYGDFTRFHRYTQYVKNLAAHDKRISFKGTFKPEKTDEIFKGIDILCVPSLWYEQIPTVVYSALMHNTPVIAPSFGALTEIIHHTQNGILFKRNDIDDLKRKIIDIIEDMSILERLRDRITPPKSMSEHADELLVKLEDYTFCDRT